jgi:two-component system C4-dicarboxylate transport response regulator DctD
MRGLLDPSGGYAVPGAAIGTATVSSSAKRKILVVEDNPNMGSLLSDMLEVFAVQSVMATDGVEALEMLERESIGLVITDLRMPKMTGTELLAAVKSQNPDMPVVIISGFSLEAAGDKDALAQADGFLSKPFRMNDIKDIIERHFKP